MLPLPLCRAARRHTPQLKGEADIARTRVAGFRGVRGIGAGTRSQRAAGPGCGEAGGQASVQDQPGNTRKVQTCKPGVGQARAPCADWKAHMIFEPRVSGGLHTPISITPDLLQDC